MSELDDRLATPSMQAFLDTPLWSRPQAVRSWEYYLGGIIEVPDSKNISFYQVEAAI